MHYIVMKSNISCLDHLFSEYFLSYSVFLCLLLNFLHQSLCSLFYKAFLFFFFWGGNWVFQLWEKWGHGISRSIEEKHMEIPGVYWKRSVFKKNNVEFSCMGLGVFGLWISTRRGGAVQRANTILHNFWV